jgi:hypothetical protein
MKQLVLSCLVVLGTCCAHKPRLTVVLNRVFQGDHEGQINCGIASSSRPNEVCLDMSGLADCTTSGTLSVAVIDPPESKQEKRNLPVTLELSPRSFPGPCFPKPRKAQAAVYVRIETQCLVNADKIGVTTRCRMP